MKKLTCLFILLISSINIFSQYGNNFPVKQITSFNFDVRNPQFLRGDFNAKRNYLFFEAHTDTSINLGVLEYDFDKDTFYNPIMLTNNSGKNINAVAGATYDKNYLFYQTNIYATWDIGYFEFENNQWSGPNVIVDSSGDEVKPKFVSSFPYSQSPFGVLFEKNGSVYLINKTDSILTIDTLFEKSDSCSYSQPTALQDIAYSGNKTIDLLYCVAVETENENQVKLVYTVFRNGIRDSVQTTIDSSNVNDPQFFWSNLTYIKKNGLYNNIFIKDLGDLKGNAQKLYDNPPGNLSNFELSDFPPIVTKRRFNKTSSIPFYYPRTYKVERNDSALIAAQFDYYYYPQGDSLIYTKFTDCKSSIGLLGMSNMDAYFYTVWSDSINGKINFKGKKSLHNLGAVEPRQIPGSYILFQNYPNPFNPSTKIRFYLPKNNNVKLVIYNVLGEKVNTLIDGYMLSGEHEIEFLPVNIASGIYFYQLVAGNYTSVKKMLYLK